MILHVMTSHIYYMRLSNGELVYYLHTSLESGEGAGDPRGLRASWGDAGDAAEAAWSGAGAATGAAAQRVS